MYSAKEFIARLGHQLSLLCVPEGFEPSSPDSVVRIERTEDTGYLGGMILHTADGSWYELALIACGRVSRGDQEAGSG